MHSHSVHHSTEAFISAGVPLNGHFALRPACTVISSLYCGPASTYAALVLPHTYLPPDAAHGQHGTAAPSGSGSHALHCTRRIPPCRRRPKQTHAGPNWPCGGCGGYGNKHGYDARPCKQGTAWRSGGGGSRGRACTRRHCNYGGWLVSLTGGLREGGGRGRRRHARG